MSWASRLVSAGALLGTLIAAMTTGVVAAGTTSSLSPVPACTLMHGLKATVHGADGASGTTFLWIAYVNAGPNECTLRGIPGAQPVVGAQHTPVGPPSRHKLTEGRGGIVFLRPDGGTANTVYTLTIQYYEPSACKPVVATAVLLHFKGTPAFAVKIPLRGVNGAVCTTLRSTTIDGVKPGLTGVD